MCMSEPDMYTTRQSTRYSMFLAVAGVSFGRPHRPGLGISVPQPGPSRVIRARVTRVSLHPITSWAIDIHVVKVRFVCSTYFLKLWFLTSVSHKRYIRTRARQLTINVNVNADVIW